MRISPNFLMSEFTCPCCNISPDTSNPNFMKLIYNLQALRNYIAKPIHISSGYRCVKKNESVGGHPSSYHLSCMAADIWNEDIEPEEMFILCNMIDGFKNGGIGVYNSHVHVDVGGTLPRRWDKRTK